MAPRFQVTAHVLAFSLVAGIGTAFAFGFSTAYGVTDDEKERVLVSFKRIVVLCKIPRWLTQCNILA
jgi:hypothetical protein